MKRFIQQMAWQFRILHKQQIVSISIGVTLIYGVILYFFRDWENVDVLLIVLVLNDPSVIGYFFIGLALYTEIKHQILAAVFVSPINPHLFLISKIAAISVIGVVCSLGLALSIYGFQFDLFEYSIGSFGICILSAILGVYMVTFANEFLKFAMISVPVFLLFINVPMAQYLQMIDLGWIKYLFPIQGSVNLIEGSIVGTTDAKIYSVASTILCIPIFYGLVYRRFYQKIIQQ